MHLELAAQVIQRQDLSLYFLLYLPLVAVTEEATQVERQVPEQMGDQEAVGQQTTLLEVMGTHLRQHPLKGRMEVLEAGLPQVVVVAQTQAQELVEQQLE